MKEMIVFKVLSFVFLFILVSGVVSAFWPFSGVSLSPVEDGTSFPNDDRCFDEDGGVFSGIPSVLTRIKNRGTFVNYWDKCSLFGSKVKEYYCKNGAAKALSIECIDGCLSKEIEIDGKIRDVGYCNVFKPSCEEIAGENGEVVGVKDEHGNEFYNVCGSGSEKNDLTVYSCDEDQVVSEINSCVRCNRAGINEGDYCTGDCSDTDPENEKDVPGNVVFDGTDNLDFCSKDNKKVIQYKCEGKDNQKLVKMESRWCGVDRACVEGSDGSYCQNNYIGYGDVTYDGVLSMLNSCVVENSDDFINSTTGNELCLGLGKTCISSIEVYSSESNNTNVKFNGCNNEYLGDSAMLSALCCSS